MEPVLLFLAVAALSVLASSPAVLRAGRAIRLPELAASGLLFLVLGAAVGPRGFGALKPELLSDLGPLVALGLGLGGVLTGLNWDARLLLRVPTRAFLAAWVDATLTWIAIALPVAPFLRWVGRQTVGASIAGAALLGAAGAVSSAHFAWRASRAGSLDGSRGLSLAVMATLQDGLALAGLALGIALGIGGGVAAGAQAVWQPLAIGGACGLLLAFFGRSTPVRSELIAVVLGCLGLVSGAAAYLKLSTLLSGAACGALLSWTGGRRAGDVFRMLLKVERPAYSVLLFVVGAHVDPRDPLAWMLALAFVGLRMVGKLMGGRLAARAAGKALQLPPDPGYALLSQGAIALCIAIELRAMVPGFASQLLIDVTAVGALVNEVLAAVLFRKALGRPAEPSPALQGDAA
jgi:hypothetical protein